MKPWERKLDRFISAAVPFTGGLALVAGTAYITVLWVAFCKSKGWW